MCRKAEKVFSFFTTAKKYYLFISRSLVDYSALQRCKEREDQQQPPLFSCFICECFYLHGNATATLIGEVTKNVGQSSKLKGDGESSSFRDSPHEILHGNLDSCSPQQRATLSLLNVCGDRANTQFANFMKLEICNVKKLVGYASSETLNPKLNQPLVQLALSTIASTKLCFYLLLKG